MLAKHSHLTSNSSSSFIQFVVQNFVARSFTHFFTEKVTHLIPDGKINMYMISSINLPQMGEGGGTSNYLKPSKRYSSAYHQRFDSKNLSTSYLKEKFEVLKVLKLNN